MIAIAMSALTIEQVRCIAFGILARPALRFYLYQLSLSGTSGVQSFARPRGRR